MNDQTLAVSTEAVAIVVDETRLYGRNWLETGGFFMAPTGTNTLTAVALAGHAGIVRKHSLFQISARAIDRLFTFADENGMWIPVQFHSHMFGARMSSADALHGFRVDGFISTILPYFADPPRDPRNWDWWRFRDGDWESHQPPAVDDDVAGTAVVFGEDGVRGR
jgi:hypothetical protein